MRKISEIIIHCTATVAGQDVSLSQIISWHRARGFRTIGYHYLIALDGTIQQGRPLDEIGAHCLGHNANSIGVAYVGGLDHDGKPADTRTAAQRSSLLSLLKSLKSKFPYATIHGHREFANKACPCFDVAEYSSL